MTIFAKAGGEKSTNVSKHFVLSPYLKFAKILNQGLKQSMLILCIYYGRVRSAPSHVYITAWEYCFFIVHLVKAFGDA